MTALPLVRGGTLLAAAGLLNAANNRRLLARPGPAPVSSADPVCVCIPARNEAARIPALLDDLRAQRGVPPLRILVLDDASEDDTYASAVRAAAGDPRVAVVREPAGPPPGWLGKPAACHRLSRLALAERTAPQVLVFVDADVRLAPDALAAGIGLLHRERLALVCPWPRQLAVGVAERLVQPLQQWSWLATLPLGPATRWRRPSMAAVCGQFLVVDAAAYQAVGGHAAVAGKVLEDLELARALRRAGYRTAPADGSRLARCRMYAGAGELRAGYGKSLWTAFGSPVRAAALFAVLAATYVLPPVAAVLGSGSTRRWGAAGYLAAVGSRVVAARVAGTQAWPDALAHPVSVLALAVLTADSHLRHRAGRLRWKGRSVATATREVLVVDRAVRA